MPHPCWRILPFQRGLYFRFFHSSKQILDAKAEKSAEKLIPVSPANWNEDWDQRSVPDEGAAGDKKIKENVRFLMFIRHAQPTDLISRAGVGLSELGKRQAQITGARLADLGYPIGVLHHSDLKESSDTASILAEILKNENPNIKVSKDALLRESIAYPPDPPINRYSDRMYFHELPAAEAVFRKYIHRPTSKTPVNHLEVFVSHGNLIRYLICRALQLSASGWGRFLAAHCSISTLIIQNDGKVFLNSFGEIGHLPLDHISGY